MRKIRLVTFIPLCYSLMGIEAIKNYNLKPFIDASCRREPDFENKYPSITSLCRKNKLAPQLRENDIVVYLSKPGKYKSSEKFLRRGRYYLVSILEVKKVCKNHQEAKEWYGSKRIDLPSNCMIKENLPEEFHRTGGNFNNQKEIKNFLLLDKDAQHKEGKTRIRRWNYHYQKRANEYSQFNITKPIFQELETPIEILREDLIRWFGKVPRTQTPKIISENQFELMKKVIKE